MEAEVKHYFNTFLTFENATFDAFLTRLSGEMAQNFAGLDLTLPWIRQCDALNNVRTARNSLSKLLRYVHCGQHYSTSFWDILWRLKEISLKSFGITYSEAGTTARELDFLSWQFLLTECRFRVKDLRNKSELDDLTSACKAFILLDYMLDGIPVPCDDFCLKRRTHYSQGGPYELYCAFADGRTISPQDVGWSWTEHDTFRKLVFPDGYQEQPKITNKPGPMPPAAITLNGLVAVQPATAELAAAARSVLDSRTLDLQSTVPPGSLANIIVATMQRLPGMPRQAISAG